MVGRFADKQTDRYKTKAGEKGGVVGGMQAVVSVTTIGKWVPGHRQVRIRVWLLFLIYFVLPLFSSGYMPLHCVFLLQVIVIV